MVNFLIKILNFNKATNSPAKKILISREAKPIEEILKSTKKLIDEKASKTINNKTSFYSSANNTNNKSFLNKLTDIKSRTLNLLNLYSEHVAKKNSYNNKHNINV